MVLTDEDPRKENAQKILEDIAKGAREEGKKDGENLFLIQNRPQAIRFALSKAKEDDIVLLLGKAHENSIIYENGAIPYDEIGEAQNALSEMGFGK